jgi:hypothetical protein
MEVVAMEAPPEADELRLYGAILEAIGAPIPAGRVLEAERAVHAQLQRLQTRLLIIDETNNLMIGSAAVQRKTLGAHSKPAFPLAVRQSRYWAHASPTGSARAYAALLAGAGFCGLALLGTMIFGARRTSRLGCSLSLGVRC